MLRPPSNRRKTKNHSQLNLIPILDAVFIFIFFLLMSANLIKVFEISSNVPIVSTKRPPKKQKKPLALMLKIDASKLTLYRGVPARLVKKFGRVDKDRYDLESLHNHLVKIKTRHKKERSIILEPVANVEYLKLVEVMDAVRMFRNTDPKITVKKEGVDTFVEELFDDIILGNIQS